MKKSIPAFALVVAAAAFAHDGMHGPGSEFDTNQDGALSKQEFAAYLKARKEDPAKTEARFKAVDTDKDGRISSAEILKDRATKPAAAK